MKIFLSWSKQSSRQAAAFFYEWLPDVVHTLDPWMSDQSIRLGSSWNRGIHEALDSSNFGILLITQDNLVEPWLLFEAGALAKHFEFCRVVPLIIDPQISAADLAGPLGQLQAIDFSRENVFRLLQDINELASQPIENARLVRSFDAHWDRLAKQMESVLAPVQDKPESEAQDGQDFVERTCLENVGSFVRRFDLRHEFERALEDAQKEAVATGNSNDAVVYTVGGRMRRVRCSP